MRIKRQVVLSGIIFVFAFMFVFAPGLRADEVAMQNGDRYFGKVVSVSPKSVTLDSENLGKISVPREKVVSLLFGTNVEMNAAEKQAPTHLVRVSPPTNPPAASASATVANTNTDLSAALRSLGANTNFVGQIRDQMLGGNSEAAGQYNKMVSDLLNGKMDLNDLRRQAQSSADQIRELKRELGPDAGDSLDGYLQVLDQFLQETAKKPAGTGAATAAPQQKKQIP